MPPKVSGSPKEPTAPRTPTERAKGRPGTAPKVGDAAGSSAARPPAPPCVKKDPTSKSLNAYITGYANVRKLSGASLIPVSCVQIEQGDPELSIPPDGSPWHLLQKSEAYLDHQGRKETPPFKGTFLTFGFTPTTATMILEQAGPMVVASDILLVFPDNLAETYIRAPSSCAYWTSRSTARAWTSARRAARKPRSALPSPIRPRTRALTW